MYRIARILTRVTPITLAFYSVKPIFNQQQSPELATNQLQKASEMLKNISMVKQSSHQENQYKQKREEQSKQQQSKQTDTKNQNQIEKEEVNTAFKGKQKAVAKISKNASKFIISYLKMQGFQIQYEDSLNKIKLENAMGEEIQIDITQNNQIKQAVNKISNFLNPPQVIKDQQSLKNILQSLPDDQNLIGIFIPHESDYKALKTPKNELDSFTNAQMVNLNQIQGEFRRKKYESNSSKNRFVIIKDQNLAKKIKMNPNKPGTEYVYYKTTYNQGMQTSSLLFGHKFTIKTNPLNVDPSKNLLSKGLYGYINQINYEGDMLNFMRSLKLKKQNRKLLVVYSKEKRPEFIRQLKSIALKTAKMVKDQAIVLMTDNPKLLTDYLQVIPDDFVTVRLLDLNKFQTPLISIPAFNTSLKMYYSRAILNGPFTVENICRLIRNKAQFKEYFEYKKQNSIKSIVSIKQQADDNTVILYWKYGCQGCQLTLKYLEYINQIIGNLDEQKQFEYQIENPQFLKKIKFTKFNILNEGEDNQKRSNDFTPRMFLHTKGQQKDLEVEKIITKINQIKAQNEEKVHKAIIKQIINKIIMQVEQGNVDL